MESRFSGSVMENPRFIALKIAGGGGARSVSHPSHRGEKWAKSFGARVFNRSVMQKMLPQEIYQNIHAAMEGKESIKQEFADAIAAAMKEWAISHGATHYTHWFQPLTGMSAEKHDSFIDWHADGVIDKFDGKQLIQGEPDASSFPSGGLRSTYEARGYTGWDPTSPAFIWQAGDGVTLCIPSIFFSWTGDVLDSKIPLLRADKKMNEAALRLLKLTGTQAQRVYSTLGLEQEYFVIDRALRNLRPDLLLSGRTVYGAASPKGQELQDHYFGSVKDRVLSYMCEVEEIAIQLGIPVKTRHNEVAPQQFELAPVFEKSTVAVDHNLLLMELMRQIAVKHDLACLLHEKPFAHLNGSGKHSNWSLATDTGINLLDPTDSPGNSLQFLVMVTAILNAVHDHSALLRASIGSSSNDYRLGGHEAPPAIISVYLGEALEGVLKDIEEKGSHSGLFSKGKYDLGIAALGDMTKDHADRNRTSPFAFTGNKFEFRAVGSSSNPAMPMTVLNAIVAESLGQIVDEIEANLGRGKARGGAPSKTALADAALPVIRKYLKQSRGIRFAGDNYSKEWVQEAKKRKLPNILKSIPAFEALKAEKTVVAFKDILTKNELLARYEIVVERYSQTVNIEANLMVDMFRTQILPAAIKYQKELATSLMATKEVLGKVSATEKQLLTGLVKAIEKSVTCVDALEAARSAAAKLHGLAQGKAYGEKVLEKAEEAREAVDHLETLVDDSVWPLPKYRELLFSL